jgi:hypothetical protein
MSFQYLIEHSTLHLCLIFINAFVCFFGAWLCSNTRWYPPSKSKVSNKLNKATFRVIGVFYLLLGLTHGVRFYQLLTGQAEQLAITSSIHEVLATAFLAALTLFLQTLFKGALHEHYLNSIREEIRQRRAPK